MGVGTKIPGVWGDLPVPQYCVGFGRVCSGKSREGARVLKRTWFLGVPTYVSLWQTHKEPSHLQFPFTRVPRNFKR